MLATTLESLLNRGLPRSPRARDLCTQLAGRQLAIHARDLAEVRLRCDGQRVEVAFGGAAECDARVSGGPLTLLGLSRPGAGPLASHPDVEVSGDAAIAEQFLELVRLLAPDLEEELALAIGDVPAHEIARFARAAFGWWRNAAETTVRNVAEYLSHERGDLVSRAEGRQLATGIDAVHDAVERLEARLNALAPVSGTARQERRDPR